MLSSPDISANKKYLALLHNKTQGHDSPRQGFYGHWTFPMASLAPQGQEEIWENNPCQHTEVRGSYKNTFHIQCTDSCNSSSKSAQTPPKMQFLLSFHNILPRLKDVKSCSCRPGSIIQLFPINMLTLERNCCPDYGLFVCFYAAIKIQFLDVTQSSRKKSIVNT